MDERPDYRVFYDTFDPATFTEAYAGSLASGINACVECCDRHTGENRTALLWQNAAGERRDLSFEELQADSARVANWLVSLGVEPGDRVSGLLPRVPELVSLILGVWRAGAVYQPLFTAFGPKAIEHRLTTSEAKLVVSDLANRPKLDEVASPPRIATLGDHGDDLEFRRAVAQQPDVFEPILRSGDEAFLMMSTSGTTGLPKGLRIPLRALSGFAAYMALSIDLRPEDTYWNIADPGWAYGLYYAITGPLLLGHQTTLFDGPFTVESTNEVVEQLGVTNLAGAPTAYRMIIAEGADKVPALARNLRVAASAGEPLNPEVMRWFETELRTPLYDHYGQTECGMVLCNHHGLAHEVRPGSAGHPMPGFRLAVVTEEGKPLDPGEQGILAIHRADSPLFFFDGYLGMEGKGWVGDYYLTGDTVEENDDGTISFVGRSDDVITSAGYRIGPFDVESCLLEHDAVAESAVVGIPDKERGELVKAFVMLQPGFTGDDALAAELQQHVRNRLGKHAFPRQIAFPESLPKTPSGKIQRFILRKE